MKVFVDSQKRLNEFNDKNFSRMQKKLKKLTEENE